MKIRQILKIFHTLGAAGMTGGLVAFMLILMAAPDISSIAEYAVVRNGMEMISTWLIVPSMALVLFSGLMVMAIHHPFHNAVWAWVKAASGILIFEETLRSIDANSTKAMNATNLALNGDIDVEILARLVDDMWLSWWTILALCLLNIILGIWRPRFAKQRRNRPMPEAAESK